MKIITVGDGGERVDLITIYLSTDLKAQTFKLKFYFEIQRVIFCTDFCIFRNLLWTLSHVNKFK